MRAGSLSDARVVAALRKYFVPVHIPMLSTADLIGDPRDRALLEKYNGGPTGGWFWGGVREVFFAPDGKQLALFMLIYPGPRQQSQLVRRVRAKPKAAVRRWFEEAGRALVRVRGALPKDWDALRRGTAPEVAAIAAVKPPATRPKGDVALRVDVRNDQLMYESLVGTDWLVLSHEEARALLPERLEPGTRRAWPRKLVLRLGRASYPKGIPYLDLADASIEGALVRGRMIGRLKLAPRTDPERGRRPTARSFRWARCRLRGEFTWDKKRRRFTRLVLASLDGKVNFQRFAEQGGKDADALPRRAIARELRNVPPEHYGTQPYAVAIELGDPGR